MSLIKRHYTHLQILLPLFQSVRGERGGQVRINGPLEEVKQSEVVVGEQYREVGEVED